ncbi:WD repeat-containing protein 27-like isoform X2 [Dendronephthya gigantea]|uniref:WD repeat-containing protein 27-like isoform X2 n=1 Tax=Dendronephthya gigantea TaxID=151771 RepID=UPI00106BA9E6|nr:WD repeat-containing protein 27-like isoform X2 [Dendronephthya gigantea]
MADQSTNLEIQGLVASCHGGNISTFSSLSNVQLACNKEWFAAPYKDNSFAIWKHRNTSISPVVLSGHRKCVTALCFGNKTEPISLATASEDCVLVWFIENKYDLDDFCTELQTITVAKDLGYVQHLSFSNCDEMISICVGNEVWVIEIETCELRTVIGGHHGNVNASKFCPVYDALLVTIGEDRTFKVCDVEQKSILYHSPIISAYPFLSLAFHSTKKEVCLGSSDGKVWIFSLDNQYKCLRSMDLNKFLAQHLESKESIESPEEPGLAVIGLCYNCISKNEILSAGHVDYHATSELLEVADSLLISTTGMLFLVNLNTCQPLKIIDLREPIFVGNECQPKESVIVSLCGSCSFYQQEEKITCILGNLFESSLHILHIFLSSNKDHNSKNTATEDCFQDAEGGLTASNQLDSPELSVLSKAPLCQNSPLKAALVPKVDPDIPTKRTVKKDKVTTKKTKQGGPQDQPVTFKTKIKSSGYTATPRTKMFSPKVTSSTVKQSKTAFIPPKPLPAKKPSSSQKEIQSEYNIPTTLKERISLCSTPVAVNQITYSGNGNKLACALSNHTAHVLDTPQTSKQRVYSGHNGAVQSVDFSHDCQYLLTSSKDNTACLWTSGNSEPVLSFQYQNQAANKPSKDNPSFSKGISQALFYYVDKFILISSGNSLFMYKYYLDFTKDDLKRYQSKSHYKLVTSLPLGKAQTITNFSCINGFFSYIVICAGSDRSLEIFDVNVNRSLKTLEDVHARNVHCIKMNQGSKTFSLPSQSYDLFLTAAIGDGVKIWDLRSTRCVRKYEGHVNRSHPIGVAWSPCAKYFAVGAEDKSTYIYDVRHSNPCERISRHSDVVFDVAFHPNTSQLVTSTLDGNVFVYSSKS